MAIEYKLPYTAFEIGDKLRTVDEVKTALENDYYTKSEVSTSFEAVNESIGEVTASLENKADLVDGKIPLEKLPDDVSSNVDLSNYYTKPETDEALSLKADLVNGKVPLEQLPDDIGGGASSWYDLEDRPFGASEVLLELPQDTSGCATVSSQSLSAAGGISIIVTKVSDNYFKSPEETFGAEVNLTANGVAQSFIVEESDILTFGNGFMAQRIDGGWYPLYMNITSVGTAVVSVRDIFGEDLNFDFSETGLYLLNTEGLIKTESLKYEGFKQIDEKFIPDIFVKLDGAGKIPLEQLPDNIGGNGGSGGGSLEQVQADFAQNDDTQVDYIKNRPFYDTRIRSYYSQAENPNPVSFDCAPIGYSFYKISDLVPTREEIFSTMKILALHNGVSDVTPPESAILVETEDFIATNDGNWGFSFVNKSGVLNFTFSGYSLSMNVSEAGIYYIRPLGSGVPEGRIFEIIVGGELKHIDPKYLPQGGSGYETKPFEDIVWDGNTDGLPMISVNADVDGAPMTLTVYKVSDCVLPITSMVDAEVEIVSQGEEDSSTMYEDRLYPCHSNGSYLDGEVVSFFCITENNTTVDMSEMVPDLMVEFPEAGIWFLVLETGGMEIQRTTALRAPRIVTKIDVKYLPTDEPYGVVTLDYAGMIAENRIRKSGTVSQWDNNPITSSAVFNALGGREQLSIDSYVSSYSDNPVSSKAVYDALGQRTSLTINDTVNSYSDNPVSSKAVYEALQNIQINVDSTVQAGSNNAVSSNAVYNAIQDSKTVVDSVVSGISNNAVSSKAVHNQLQNYYTKSEVDTALDNVSVDLSNYYTKSEVNSLLGDIDTVLDEINALIESSD